MYAAIMMAIFVMIVAPLGAMRFHEKDDEIREFEGFEAPIKWISKLGAMVFIMVLSMEVYFEVFDLIDAFLAYARSNHPAEESVFCFVVVMAGIGFLCYKALTMVAVVGSWLKCGFITWDRSRRERKAKKAHDELMQKIADIVLFLLTLVWRTLFILLIDKISLNI